MLSEINWSNILPEIISEQTLYADHPGPESSCAPVRVPAHQHKLSGSEHDSSNILSLICAEWETSTETEPDQSEYKQTLQKTKV